MPPANEPVNLRPAVAIVIVTYNSASTLAACVESVTGSLAPGDEVVFIDNASRDETVTLLRQLIGQHHACRIIRNEVNAGFARATNQGIQATRNPLVVLLNPDTIVPKEWLNGLSRHMSASVASVGPVSNYVAGIQKMELYQREPLPSGIQIDSVAELFHKWNEGRAVDTRLLIGFCMMIRRDALETVGHLDDELFLGNDDLDISWRLRLQGYQLMVATDVFVYHTGQVSFLSEPNEKTKQLVQQSTDYLYRKLSAHYAPEQVPSPLDLWGIDWFCPSPEALEQTPSNLLLKSGKSQLVSIIILTWNQLALTKTCLASIVEHTSEPYELIMVDNGSTDGTVTWLRQQADRDRRITIIENAVNMGFAAGCNQGIRVAKGSRLVLLNNDTVVTPGWLSGMNELLDRYPDAGIIGPMTNSASGIQVVPDVAYTLDSLPLWAETFRQQRRYRIIPHRRIVGFCMLFRRELSEKIGLLDESFGVGNYEDDDFCLRVELAGFRNLIAGDVFIHHVGGASFSGNNLIRSTENRNNRVKFRQKWEPSRLEESLLRRWLVLQAIEEATVSAKRGDIKTAVSTLLNKAIRIDSNAMAPYTVLAEILIIDGQYEDALEVLPEMPSDIDGDLKLELAAICHCAIGNDAAARQTAEQVALRPRARVVLGTLAARQGDLAEAERLFRLAIAADPSCGSGWLSLGMLLWGQGKHNDAFEALKRAVTVDSLNREAVQILRDMAHRMDGQAAAVEILASASQAYPSCRHLALHKALLLTQTGQDAAASAACEEFLARFGADDQVLDAARKLRERAGFYHRLTEADQQSISLCMIVKDEEHHLARCLASARPVVHELVVVDTGSADRTVAIAEAFGARVVRHAWHDDYAAARNVGLAVARGEWILVLDADEVLSPRDYLRIAQAAGDEKTAAWQVTTRNYVHQSTCQGWQTSSGEYPDEEMAEGWYPSVKVRLFRRDSRIRFAGVVHEMVESALRSAGYAIRNADFVVHHYGELDTAATLEKKERYYRLGLAKLEQSPGDPVLLAELAVQSSELGRLGEALELWDRLLERQPENPEALFNRGGVLLLLKRYRESVDSSRRATQLAPSLKEAWLNLVMANIGLADLAAAKVGLVRLAALAPDYPPLWAAGLVTAVLLDDTASAMRYAAKLRQQGYGLDGIIAQRADDLQQAGHGALAECLRTWVEPS